MPPRIGADRPTPCGGDYNEGGDRGHADGTRPRRRRGGALDAGPELLEDRLLPARELDPGVPELLERDLLPAGDLDPRVEQPLRRRLARARGLPPHGAARRGDPARDGAGRALAGLLRPAPRRAPLRGDLLRDVARHALARALGLAPDRFLVHRDDLFRHELAPPSGSARPRTSPAAHGPREKPHQPAGSSAAEGGPVGAACRPQHAPCAIQPGCSWTALRTPAPRSSWPTAPAGPWTPPTSNR